MSPRYFAKFSDHPNAEHNWYHFTGKNFSKDSLDYKLYIKYIAFKYKIKHLFKK